MKKIIEEKIVASLDIQTDYSYHDKPYCINKLIDYLEENKNKGATHVKLEGYYDGDTVDSVDVEAIIVNEESDEDYNRRMRDEKSTELAKQSIAKAKERELYEELKLKYEK